MVREQGDRAMVVVVVGDGSLVELMGHGPATRRRRPRAGGSPRHARLVLRRVSAARSRSDQLAAVWAGPPNAPSGLVSNADCSAVHSKRFREAALPCEGQLGHANPKPSRWRWDLNSRRVASRALQGKRTRPVSDSDSHPWDRWPAHMPRSAIDRPGPHTSAVSISDCWRKPVHQSRGVLMCHETCCRTSTKWLRYACIRR
jgi:hypothetical protein